MQSIFLIFFIEKLYSLDFCVRFCQLGKNKVKILDVAGTDREVISWNKESSFTVTEIYPYCTRVSLAFHMVLH